MAKKNAGTKKSGTSPRGTKKPMREAGKPSGKKAARKPQEKTSARKVTKKAVKKPTSKTTPKAVKPSGKKIATSVPLKEKKFKSPLNKKQLQEFRELLLQKRKSLLGDMTGIQSSTLGRNLQESSGDLSNMPTHQADIGSDNFEYEFTLGLLESERSLLREVNEALERIEDGSYGVCLGTGDPIGLARLRARPWCKYCIEYQKMVEKGLVKPGQSESYESPEDTESESEPETETEPEPEVEEEDEVREEED